MTKILLTGGTGFLGRNVAWRLVEEGHEVHNLERPGSDRSALLSRENGQHVNSVAMAADFSGLYETVRALMPDVCINLAATVVANEREDGIRQMIDANLLMPSLIARALLDLGHGTIITCGSSWQTAGGHGGYVPFDFYAGTKQALEDLLKAYVVQGLPAIALRLYDNYGPHDTRRKIVDLIFDCAITGRPLAMSPGEQDIDLVHVEDAAHAVVMAAERAAGLARGQFETYGVSSGQPHRLKDIAALISDIAGRPAPIDWGGRPYREREIMKPYNGFAPVPGWAPRITLEAGLKDVWAAKPK